MIQIPAITTSENFIFFTLSLSKIAVLFTKSGLSESSTPVNITFTSFSPLPTTIISPKSKFSTSSTSSVLSSIFSISVIFSSTIKILRLFSSPICKISILSLLFPDFTPLTEIPRLSPLSSFISISSISPKFLSISEFSIIPVFWTLSKFPITF